MIQTKSKWKVVNITDRVVYIIDQGGQVTVTNDAEAVYLYIKQQIPDRKIVYQGTDDEWFEILPVETWMGEHIGFKPWNGEVWDILTN